MNVNNVMFIQFHRMADNNKNKNNINKIFIKSHMAIGLQINVQHASEGREEEEEEKKWNLIQWAVVYESFRMISSIYFVHEHNFIWLFVIHSYLLPYV